MSGMLINVFILVMCTDVCFDCFEQMIHYIEFRTLFGKPDQFNIPRYGYCPACRGCVCTGCIEQYSKGTPRIRATYNPQELLKTALLQCRIKHCNAMTGAHIDSTKEYPFSILT